MVKFIERLQNSDEKTKTKWLIILSAASMAVVVAVWLIYFNNLTTLPTDERPAESGVEFTDVFLRGISVLKDIFVSRAEKFIDLFKTSRSYMIAPNQ